MSNKSSNIRLGLFVIAAVTLVAVVVVWLSASKYMKGAAYYVTFFDESVQGLQVDSKVKYRGVEVGRVTDIRVAPDFKLIEVLMQIGFEGNLSGEMVAQLQSVGITGIVFVELNRQKPGDKQQSPRIDFAAEYPIIPSKPSEMQQLMSVVDRITRQLSRIDFEGLGDDLSDTLKAVREMVRNASLQKSIANLENTAANLKAITQSIMGELKNGRINRTINLVEDSARNLDALLREARQALDEMQLRKTAADIRDFMVVMKNQALDITSTVRQTMNNLRSSSLHLDRLLLRIERNPSDLIFSQPPQGR